MKAVGFDADGVLVDSREAAWRAAMRVLDLFGVTASIGSPEAMEAAFGAAAQEALVGREHAGALRMIHRLLMRQSAPSIRLFDDVIDVVAAMPGRRLLVTAALGEGIRVCLGQHASHFEDILGFERGRKPDLLAELANELGAYITDTAIDVRDCQAVGVPVIGCMWGYDSRETLEAARPDAIAERPDDLPALLDSLMLETSR